MKLQISTLVPKDRDTNIYLSISIRKYNSIWRFFAPPDYLSIPCHLPIRFSRKKKLEVEVA